MIRRRRGERGFTLIEALVALGVFGLVMLLLQGATWSSRMMLRVVRPDPNPVLDGMVTRRVLEGWFASALLVPEPVAGGLTGLTGSVSDVEFSMAVAGAAGGLRVARARLSIERDETTAGESSRLTATRSLLGASDDGQASSLLLDWAGPLAFAYAEGEAGRVRWTSTWSQRDRLPSRVALMSRSGPVLSFSLPAAVTCRGSACERDPPAGAPASGRP